MSVVVIYPTCIAVRDLICAVDRAAAWLVFSAASCDLLIVLMADVPISWIWLAERA